MIFLVTDEFKDSLYILDGSLLSDLQIFVFNFRDFPFIFLMVSLEAHKFLVLMKSNLLFSFIACAFGVLPKKHCLIEGHKDSFICFLLRGL